MKKYFAVLITVLSSSTFFAQIVPDPDATPVDMYTLPAIMLVVAGTVGVIVKNRTKAVK